MSNRTLVTLAAGVMLMAFGSAASAADRAQMLMAPAIPYPVIDPQKVADVFIAAVGRGELVLFGNPLAANALDPRQVEYVYSLQPADPLPTVRIHAALTQPFPLPGAPEIRATGVTGVLDWEGRIIDLFVHGE